MKSTNTSKSIQRDAVSTENELPESHAIDAEVPHSIFSKSQRRGVTLMIGVAMMFSPLSANIYLPCIPLLQKDMQTTTQLINLTITAYIIVQGVAPAFLGELCDKLGRRPIYILAFGFYVAASIGLAVQHSYAALLSLRMLQSLGASATVAIGYGVVADMVAPAERGRMLGPAMVATNLGPILGPVIGGPLAATAGWRWVFWLLTILGSVFLLLILLFLPETCKTIVGNGSIPAQGWNRSWVSYLSGAPTEKQSLDAEEQHAISEITSPSRTKNFMAFIPNPWKSVRLLFEKDTSLVLSLSVQASIPTSLSQIYHYSAADIRLCYFAIGVGVAIGGYINGKVMDHNYRSTAQNYGLEVNKVAGDDLRAFPIEEARSRFAVIYILLHSVLLVGYGWLLHQKTHVAGPLILQFCIGFIATVIVQTFNTLIVDIHQDIPSTAAAAGNIVRCGLAAGGVAIMQPLLRRLDYGFFFTVLGCVTGGAGLISVFIIRRQSMRWRIQRGDKKQEASLDKLPQ
ncbi:Major facilitator superfamily domain general substrate transporter protein [Rutstroemia sp. NJR-2017a BBW]|nr:Major facilitator superfamily domain general substrate transporter protein [Rutstroemia sp. NJR-2017a BBW]